MNFFEFAGFILIGVPLIIFSIYMLLGLVITVLHGAFSILTAATQWLLTRTFK